MPSMKDLFPSKYLAANDIDEEMVVTIKRIAEETLGQGADAADKWILYFKGVEKGLVLNKTNANTLAGLLGDDTDDWIGKRVTLCVMDVEFKGKLTPGIRVRSKLPKGKAEAEKVAKPASREPGDDDDKDDDGIPY